MRELRLIDAHQPRYNRRSRRQGLVWWVTLTSEAHPRPSVVRRADRGSQPLWGPFTSRRAATRAAIVVAEAFGLRQCSGALLRHPDGCPLAEMGRCSAPCLDPDVDYSTIVDRVRLAMTGDVRDLTDLLAKRIAQLSTAERFEEAAEFTNDAKEVLRATRRRSRLVSLASCPPDRRSAARRRVLGNPRHSSWPSSGSWTVPSRH